MTEFQDLHTKPENERIKIIGKAVMEGKHKTGAFVVEDNEKAKRYIRKLKMMFPDILVDGPFDGPTIGTVTVKIERPDDEE